MPTLLLGVCGAQGPLPLRAGHRCLRSCSSAVATASEQAIVVGGPRGRQAGRGSMRAAAAAQDVRKLTCTMHLEGGSFPHV